MENDQERNDSIESSLFSCLVANEAVLTQEKLNMREWTYVPDVICVGTSRDSQPLLSALQMDTTDLENFH